MAKQVQLEENDLPLGTDLSQEAAPVNQNPSNEGQQNEKKEYKPSAETLERLNKFPKDEIKKELGLDIDKLIKTTKKRGVLEALAYGDYTRPLDLELRTEHGARLKIKGTIRIYVFPDGNWYTEVHPILPLKEKINKDGKKVMTYDRNPITEEDVKNRTILLNGKPLTSEQADRLRLTGHLGEPVAVTNKDGESVNIVVSVDPYNNHELCKTTEKSIRKKLEKQNEFKYTDENKEIRTILLTDKMKGELALGHGVWGVDDKGNNKYLQYNVGGESSGIVLSKEYSFAVKEERSRKESNAVTNEQTQSTAVQNQPAVGVGHSL